MQLGQSRSLYSQGTAAGITPRSTFKIEDPSLGPGRVDFRDPDEGFGLEGAPKPKILICGQPRYLLVSETFIMTAEGGHALEV